MIPENVIGYNPIFIIQVTSLIYKKGMTILYENFSKRLQIKEQLAKVNCSIQGDTENTKWVLAYSLSTLWT